MTQVNNETESESESEIEVTEEEIDSVFYSEVPIEDFFRDFNQSENYANFSVENSTIEESILKPVVFFIERTNPKLIEIPKRKDLYRESLGQMKILKQLS